MWSDVDSFFRLDASGNLKIHKDSEAINQSLRNFFSTIRGQRVRRTLGSGLITYLFEDVSEETAEDIQDVIETGIERYEPRVNLRRVRVNPLYDSNAYQIQIRYQLVSSGEFETLEDFLSVFS